MLFLRATVAALILLAVAACGPAAQKFRGSDITGIGYGRDFRLIDHTGRPRTLADFRGKVVVLFFGYTQCPDVCPTTLSQLAATMQKLGPDAARVQVLFVTVDPERDTADLLARYVPAFNASFLGLYGDATATAETAKEFKILYQKQPGPNPGGYTVDHSAGTYLFDPQGRLRVFESYGQGPDVFAHDIRALLQEPLT
ncbi:MAG: SCO family protein [Betaproteobacteria bacterium]|nr:MAG: SCO family protein [Betaproteobacteria bacterium]